MHVVPTPRNVERQAQGLPLPRVLPVQGSISSLRTRLPIARLLLAATPCTLPENHWARPSMRPPPRKRENCADTGRKSVRGSRKAGVCGTLPLWRVNTRARTVVPAPVIHGHGRAQNRCWREHFSQPLVHRASNSTCVRVAEKNVRARTVVPAPVIHGHGYYGS